MATGSRERQRWDACRCAQMSREGKTTRQISDATGIAVESIKQKIIIGERLSQLDEYKSFFKPL